MGDSTAPHSSTPTISTNSSDIVSLEEKWDHSVENGIRKVLVGCGVGLIPAALCCRKNAGRIATVLFSTGFGLGMAYQEMHYLFQHDVTFDRRNIAQINISVFPPPASSTVASSLAGQSETAQKEI